MVVTFDHIYIEWMISIHIGKPVNRNVVAIMLQISLKLDLKQAITKYEVASAWYKGWHKGRPLPR